jgi:hypothetical protein
MSPFTANSILFQQSRRASVLLSNLGLLLMVWALILASRTYGLFEVIKYYTIPWLCVTHWFIMITYLHHTVRSLSFSLSVLTIHIVLYVFSSGPKHSALPYAFLDVPARGCCNHWQAFPWLARQIFLAWCRTLSRHPPFLHQGQLALLLAFA